MHTWRKKDNKWRAKKFSYFYFLVLIIGMGLSGCLSPESRYTNEYLPGPAKQGKEIFNSHGVCHVCHGIDADIRTMSDTLKTKLNPLPTNLRNPHELRYKSDEEMRSVFTHGIPDTSMVAMGPPDGKLGSEEIELLIIYLKEIRKR